MSDGFDLAPLLDADEAVVVRVRHELEPHAQRLLVSLGAGWIVDGVRGERCVGSCGHPECDVSEQLIVVEVIDGTADTSLGHTPALCGTEGTIYVKGGALAQAPWCDQCVAASGKPEPFTERSTPMATATATCKKDGCERAPNPRFSRGYQYGFCDEHAAERGSEIATARRNGAALASVTGGGMSSRSSAGAAAGYVARVRALIPAARSLDQARRKLDAAGSSELLKADFDEASNRARAVPNDENLERLERASKALRKGAGSRTTVEAAFNDATHKFKLALGTIARDINAA